MGSGSPISAITTVDTTCGRWRLTAAASTGSPGAPSTIASRCGRTTARRVAFSSDRGNPLGSDYNIWVLDTRTGEFRQLTKDPAEDYMPSWSPDDREIAFASTRDSGQSAWAVSVADLTERKLATVAGGRVDAPSWGPGGQVVYHVTAGAEEPVRGGRQAPHRHRERLRVPGLVGLAHGVLLRVGREDPASRAGRRRRADRRLRLRRCRSPSRSTRGACATSPRRRPVRRWASSVRSSRPMGARSPLPPSATSTSCPLPGASP